MYNFLNFEEQHNALSFLFCVIAIGWISTCIQKYSGKNAKLSEKKKPKQPTKYIVYWENHEANRSHFTLKHL